MNILVTGAAGFVGSHLSEALIVLGHDVIGLDGFLPYYARPTKEANLTELNRSPGFRFHELDLRTADLDSVVEGCEAVIHLAAMPGLPRSWTDVDDYVSCNILAVHRLIEAARRSQVRRFIHVSTSSVYGIEAVGDETQPTRPISPYGVTKLAAEHLVLAYVASFGLPATILRYFSLYGPRQRPDMAYHRFIEQLLDGEEITVFGDGEQSRSITFVDDAVRGTVQAIGGARVGAIYNIGGGERITLNESIALLGDLVGTVPRVKHTAARPGDQRHTMADTTLAARDFGYEATVPPRVGLARQVEWHRDRRRAGGPPRDPASRRGTP